MNIKNNTETVIEHGILRGDGTRIVVETHGRPVSSDGIRRHTALRDITERKRSEDALRTANAELEGLNNELEAFNHSISHDLRAPLRSMSGFSASLMEDHADKLDEQGKDYLGRIRRGAEKLSRLIDALLNLSAMSRQEIDRMEIDLSKLAESVAYSLRESSPGRKVEVVIQENVKAFVDSNLFRVVMTNLLENAWKFTAGKENARIEFGTIDCGMRNADCGLRKQATESNNSGFQISDFGMKEKKSENENKKLAGTDPDVSQSAFRIPQSTMVYFVRDNGAGFDQEYAQKMFWPFHRLHSEKEFSGTGIGLAMVDRIVRRHGGRVWAEGEIGKGATVYFTVG